MCDISGVVDDVGSYVGNLGTDTSNIGGAAGGGGDLFSGFQDAAQAAGSGAAASGFADALPAIAGLADTTGGFGGASGVAGGIGSFDAGGGVATGIGGSSGVGNPFSAVPSNPISVNPLPGSSVVPVGDFAGGSTSGDISALQGGTGGGNTVVGQGGAAGSSGGLFGGAGDFLSKNAKWLIPAAALGYSAMKGSNTSPKSQPEGPQQQQIANDAAANSQKFLNPLANGGPLPPGAQAGIDLATKSAKSALQSKFASMGMSGSTQEVDALNQVDMQAQSQGFQVASQLAQTGLSEQQIAQGVYTQLMNTSLLQDQQLTQALAQFASAAGGAGQTVKLNVA